MKDLQWKQHLMEENERNKLAQRLGPKGRNHPPAPPPLTPSMSNPGVALSRPRGEVLKPSLLFILLPHWGLPFPKAARNPSHRQNLCNIRINRNHAPSQGNWIRSRKIPQENPSRKGRHLPIDGKFRRMYQSIRMKGSRSQIRTRGFFRSRGRQNWPPRPRLVAPSIVIPPTSVR